MAPVSWNVIGLLAVAATLLEIKYTQADCPLPSSKENVEANYPSQDVINRRIKEDTFVRFNCSQGFFYTKGDRVIFCFNGEWKAIRNERIHSPIPFECTEQQCPVEISYSCARGYGLNKFQQKRCRQDEKGDFYLISPLPTCKPLLKCDQPTVPYLQVNGSCCYAGDEVTFLCEDGYTVEGVSSAVCLQTATWSQPIPHCIKTMETVSTGNVGTDVFFAFDGSSRITKQDFEEAKEFVITLIRQLGIPNSDDGVRVAVIIFSKEVKEIGRLNSKTIGEVVRAIKDMKGERMGTDIMKGFRGLEYQASMSNPNLKKIAFMITDGMWNQGGDPTSKANRMVDPNIYNVELYAIGIGRRRNDYALMKLVGPNKDRVLISKNYEELVNIAAKAVNRHLDYSACGIDRSVLFNGVSVRGNRRVFNGAIRRFKRVVGGQDVKRPWPWMAALSQKGEPKCGGSIIHQQWILTAAQCFGVTPNMNIVPSDWLVTVGATDLSEEGGWDLRVSDIFVHENYNTDNLDFDAALVKLKVSIPYGLYIRPICLPPAFKDLPKNIGLYAEDKEAMTIGYGHTEVMQIGDEEVITTDKLQELELKLQSKEVCQKEVSINNFPFQPTPQMICAGSGLGGKDSCKGDSGGPLMQMTVSTSRNNTQERWFLVGIESWGVGCGLKGYYSYYSYVAKLREWINKTTKVEFENAIPKSFA